MYIYTLVAGTTTAKRKGNKEWTGDCHEALSSKISKWNGTKKGEIKKCGNGRRIGSSVE